MPQRRLWMWTSLTLTLATASFGAHAQSSLQIAVTFSVLGDVVKQVAGDAAEVSVLTPVNAEVHEWELTPRNFAHLERADIVFYNGYQLEQWMGQVEATVRDGVPLIAVAEASGYPTQSIVTGELSGDVDPHLWMDPRAVAAYAEVIADTLADVEPGQAQAFEQRAHALSESLDALYEDITQTLAPIDEDQRFLLSSEAAFTYFADAFDFDHTGIWGNNAESEGSPRQLMAVVDKINARQPGAIFWESTISDRHVTSIARDTGVSVAGPLYVDSLSEPDGPASSYQEMMRYNAELLRRYLGPEADDGE
ncbi:ABC transporter substrate-binding protein [Halomonas alkaliantarctica]|nr:ABC transporter substrate-binding protein [Halomonas alkaliantarctica]